MFHIRIFVDLRRRRPIIADKPIKGMITRKTACLNWHAVLAIVYEVRKPFRL